MKRQNAFSNKLFFIRFYGLAASNMLPYFINL